MNEPAPTSGRFTGKTVLVTGAAGGIGQATVARFIREGAHAVLVDMDLAALTQQAERFGSAVSIFQADVANEAQADAAMTAALAIVQRIDIAVLNAGIEGARGPLHATPVQEFDRVLAVNVRGVFIWLSRLMAHMRNKGGGVITITSSVAGLRGAVGMAPYITSKHAVIGLMKVAALEGAAHNIRVNTINPGPIDTRMMQAIDESVGALEEVRAKKFARIPLGRYGTPDEVAAMTAFLSSEDAGYCTGGSYLADGGAMAGSVG